MTSESITKETSNTVPCWFKKDEPKCPANVRTAECYLWSPGSYALHIPMHLKPARCPLAGKRIAS